MIEQIGLSILDEEQNESLNSKSAKRLYPLEGEFLEEEIKECRAFAIVSVPKSSEVRLVKPVCEDQLLNFIPESSQFRSKLSDIQGHASVNKTTHSRKSSSPKKSAISRRGS